MPLTTQKVDMSSSLRGWAESAVVYQVSKIKRAFVVRPKSEDDDVVIKTDGVNIQAMFKFSKILDLNRLYCNDVHQIAEHYGVEAASQVIVKVRTDASRRSFVLHTLQSLDLANPGTKSGTLCKPSLESMTS